VDGLLKLAGQAGYLGPQGINLLLGFGSGGGSPMGSGGGFAGLESAGFQLHLLPELAPFLLEALGCILGKDGKFGGSIG